MRKYGWPLLLFMGVPLASTVVRTTYYAAFDSGLVSHDSNLLPTGLGSVTTTVLLGALYPRVRNVDQATLRLVWSCTLVTAAMSATVFLGAGFAGYGNSLRQFSLVIALDGFLSLFPLLWFARQASRLSLAHAFFLVLVIGGLTLPDLTELLHFYSRLIWGLAASLLAVWLLANFDQRSPAFRRWSVVVLVALNGLALLLPPLDLAETGAAYSVLLVGVGIVPSFVLLVLVYLVRVRRPAAEVPLTPPSKEC